MSCLQIVEAIILTITSQLSQNLKVLGDTKINKLQHPPLGGTLFSPENTLGVLGVEIDARKKVPDRSRVLWIGPKLSGSSETRTKKF